MCAKKSDFAFDRKKQQGYAVLAINIVLLFAAIVNTSFSCILNRGYFIIPVIRIQDTAKKIKSTFRIKLLQIKDRRILPLCFVLGRRLVKPFCRKSARYHILIDPFKKRIQVLIPALQRYNVYLCFFDRQLSSCIGIFLLTNAASNCWI